jgi:pyrimidine-nucleoside phosphorylase
MRFVDVIRAKRDGAALERDVIEAFVTGVTDGSLPAYQVSALLMAIVLRGMTADETAWLTDAMARSGTRLDLSDIPGAKVDKHSTGGVGDKTSLILAPLAAACGAIVPMMSGRGLGHTGGTLDKLESIPGFRVGLSLDELRASLKTVGCALVGQTAEIAPADRALYALRDVTGTVESVPLITASIMSKKIAEGISGLVLDVKVGRGAFMKTEAEARQLAESLVAAGRAAGVRTEAIITCMDAPLGRTVGNALEVVECTEVLKGRGSADLKQLSALLAARLLVLAGIAPSEADAERRVLDALASGRALETWRAIIANQGGDPHVVDEYRLLPMAPLRHIITAPRAGFLAVLDAELIGRATMALGAGRNRVDDQVDPAVGADILAKPGARVAAGDPVVVLHYRRERDLPLAVDLATRAVIIADEAPTLTPLVRGRIGE